MNAKFILNLLILSSLTYFSFGQNRSNNWYFGANAGIDFNAQPAVATLNGKLNTDEGCAVISDENGNLIFYTDGVNVWNRNHEQMPNGFGLLGHVSSTQSALIIQDPGNTNLYFIFTVDAAENNLASGLRYSLVDITAQGGLGDIINKNIYLQGPVTEKIVAVKHANNNDYWIITHEWNSNNFFSTLLTDAGIQTASISNVGSFHGGPSINAVWQYESFCKWGQNCLGK